MRSALQIACAVPAVPTFSQYVAHLKMCGYNVLPEDLWNVVAPHMGDLTDYCATLHLAGWVLRTNHQRSNSHEAFQYCMTMNTGANEAGTWVIPCDELECLYEDDPTLNDFVQLSRLTFVGTEQEMRSSVPALLDAIVEHFCNL